MPIRVESIRPANFLKWVNSYSLWSFKQAQAF
jgi:hypothetical protein